MNDIFVYLGWLWSSYSGDNNVKKKILSCLEAWINNTNVSVDDLLPQPIFNSALECLSEGNDLYIEDAANICIAVIEKYRHKDIRVPQRIIPAIMPLRRIWASKVQDDPGDIDDDARHICLSIGKLFGTASEIYIDLLLGDVDVRQNEIFAQLLDCARFPEDVFVSRTPLRFFEDVAEEIRKDAPGRNNRR